VKLNVVNDGFWLSGETIYKCTTVRNGELLLVVLLSLMPMLFRIMHYAGKLKPYSVVSKDAGLILKIRA
ncbi:hypothetical protein ABNIH6_01180, partial [Acinetobacter baumannii ABNIH6]